MTDMQVTRRSFIAQVSAVAGGFALGFHLPDGDGTAAAQTASEVNSWIVIRPDNAITIRVARAEMGQGAFTCLPMLVAEELECDWSKVSAEYVSPEENLRRNRVFGAMSTGGSRSIRDSHEYLRKAGAVAREMLIAAAAARWDVPAGQCRAQRSVITHTPSGRTVTFGEVAADAARRTPPTDAPLKDPRNWQLLNTSPSRLDVPDKTRGKTVYGIDVRAPNMLFGAIAQSPVFGGRVASINEAAIANRRGVRKVVNLGEAVAVVADSTWTARQALDALPITWDTRNNGAVSSATIAEFLRTGLAAPQAPEARKDGDPDTALASAARKVEAEYGTPFLAHATMEPMNCTAHVTPDKVEIWVSSQNAEASLAAAAAAADMPTSKVAVHRTHLGGGFGRRGGTQDYVRLAVLVAKQLDRPVQLVWSREEDIQHDFYRPVSMAKMTAGLDAAGNMTALKVRISGQSIAASLFPDRPIPGGVDRTFLTGWLQDMAYAIPNYVVEYAMRNTHVPVGPWRGVNSTQHAFYKECFIDEVAHAAGVDPYQFRRRMLTNKPRDLGVLDAAARAAGWGNPLPAGVFRGIAVHESYGSHCAQVAEVSVDARGRLKVHRVVSAIDAGHVIHPRLVEMQTESSIVYAMTALLYGEITIKDGRVEQGNFHDYEMLRIDEMPRVETVIASSGGFWGGVGEPAVPPLAPAVCNAIFAATGKRVRSLPLKHHDLRRV
jgi:isoquinoline 1-oxidoreductase beta subunit